MKNAVLQAELDTLIATQAGLMAIVGSLMATHPHFEQFQLHLTGLLEVLLTGVAGQTFKEKQRQQARDFVQTLQNINEAPSKSKAAFVNPESLAVAAKPLLALKRTNAIAILFG